jgi:hypothetical protein
MMRWITLCLPVVLFGCSGDAPPADDPGGDAIEVQEQTTQTSVDSRSPEEIVKAFQTAGSNKDLDGVIAVLTRDSGLIIADNGALFEEHLSQAAVDTSFDTLLHENGRWAAVRAGDGPRKQTFLLIKEDDAWRMDTQQSLKLALRMFTYDRNDPPKDPPLSDWAESMLLTAADLPQGIEEPEKTLYNPAQNTQTMQDQLTMRMRDAEGNPVSVDVIQCKGAAGADYEWWRQDVRSRTREERTETDTSFTVPDLKIDNITYSGFTLYRHDNTLIRINGVDAATTEQIYQSIEQKLK